VTNLHEDRRILSGFDWRPNSSDLSQHWARFIEARESGKQAIEQYEATLEKLIGLSGVLAFASGTLSLLAAYSAAGVSLGDEVIVSPLAPSPTVLPVAFLGARPVFADVASAASFRLDLSDVESLFSTRTRAVVDVPMWGACYGASELRDLCHRKGVVFIQDLSQCHGTLLHNAHIGFEADIACFSTQGRKLVSTGEGGFAVAADERLVKKMKALRDYGELGSGFSEAIGLNLKLGWSGALLGHCAVVSLKDRIAIRRANAAKLAVALQGIFNIAVWREEQAVESSYYGFPVSLTPIAVSGQQVSAQLNAIGIETDTFRYKYDVLYNRVLWSGSFRKCARAEQLAARLIVLPCHDGIRDEDLAVVANGLDRLLSPLTAD
jgi:perosamine synthetase